MSDSPSGVNRDEDDELVAAADNHPIKSRLERLRVVFEVWWARNRFRVYIVGLVLTSLLVILWDRIFITVESGHQGIMFRRFAGGTVTDRLWGEGFHAIPPWDKLAIYETRIQERNFTFPTLTRDGLRIHLSISVRYQPRLDKLGYLHRDIGPGYYERIIKPEIKSALRQTVGDRTAFEIYSTEGDVLQQALKDATINIERKPIKLDHVLIEEIQLPPIVRQAIDHKHKQEQALLEYEFRLQSAEKEAERQRTIATGVRDYNSIIATQPIPEDILRWKGIEATIELAKSNNSKMIIIGGGENGLPIILDASGNSLPSSPQTSQQKSSDKSSDTSIESPAESPAESPVVSPTASTAEPTTDTDAPGTPRSATAPGSPATANSPTE